MATRRPTDGRKCRRCQRVFFDPEGRRDCAWCIREERWAAEAPYVQEKLRRITGRLKSITARDGWDCWLCGKRVDPYAVGPHRASADHVVPRRLGGPNCLSNLKLAHASCNEYRSGSKVMPFAPFDNRWVADHKRREALP